MKPESLEENIVWYAMVCVYIIYSLGLTYPLYSMLAWFLLLYTCKKKWDQAGDIKLKQNTAIPWIIWLWIISMIVMAVSSVFGHVDFGYDVKAIIRALLNWTRDWALFALFPLAGCCLKIRSELIYRASCIVSLQNICFAFFSYLAFQFNLPSLLYSSPLERLTQNGPIYYNVNLYLSEYGSDTFRLTLFAPWSPGLALICCIYFIFSLYDKNWGWKAVSIFSNILCLYLSASRTSFIALPAVLLIVFLYCNIHKGFIYLFAGAVSFLSAIFSDKVFLAFSKIKDSFRSARADSSHVREVLARIALARWQEAKIWGHGNLEPGSEATKGMPIGSHHTWIGLLFVKGLVGFTAFLVPIVASLIYLLIKARKNEVARASLGFLLMLLFFTFTDNQEVLAYLYWPGLILMGTAFKPEQFESIKCTYALD